MPHNFDKDKHKLSLHHVALRSVSQAIDASFYPGFATINCAPQYKANCIQYIKNTLAQENTEATNFICFVYECGMRLIDTSKQGTDEIIKESSVIFEIEVEFCAYYSFKEEVSNSTLDEFGRRNVGYHVWPYWRELNQSLCIRSDIGYHPLPSYQDPGPSTDKDNK